MVAQMDVCLAVVAGRRWLVAGGWCSLPAAKDWAKVTRACRGNACAGLRAAMGIKIPLPADKKIDFFSISLSMRVPQVLDPADGACRSRGDA